MNQFLFIGGPVLLALAILFASFFRKMFTVRRLSLSREENEILWRLKGRSFFIVVAATAKNKEKILKEIAAVLLLYKARVKQEDDGSAWKLKLFYSPYWDKDALVLIDPGEERIMEIHNPKNGFEFMREIEEAIEEYERQKKEEMARNSPNVLELRVSK